MAQLQTSGTVVRFATAVVKVFGPEYLREPNAEDTRAIQGTSRHPEIACTAIGRTAHMFNKGNTRDIIKSPPSFLKRLHHKTFGFDTLSLACQGLTMTSMCCSGLHCLQGCVRTKLLHATTPSMGMSTTWGTIFVVIYPPWATFVKTIFNPLGNKNLTLLQDKVLERMWRGHLECSKPGLQLFANLLHNGIQRHCGR